MQEGKDFIGAGVGAVIFNQDGKLLVALRGDNVSNEAGKWEFPGGTIEYGEKIKDAIVREIKEEFGIDIEVIKLLDVYDHLIPAERQHWISPTYLCKLLHGEPHIQEPGACEKVKWHTLDEIENLPLTIVTQENVQDLRKKYPTGSVGI